jgi:multiple sugar transport system substrate-binding protein
MRILRTLLLVIPFILLTACTPTAKPPEDVTLTYWGVFEPKSNYDELINEFQSKNPHIKINYLQKSLKEYQQQIIARNGQPNGPDIFRYNNSWLPGLKKILAITPQTTVDALNFEKTFYPVVVKDLQAQPRGYYGVPLMYDGLALFYNKKIFEAKGINEPPKEWDELIETAKKLRVPQAGDDIEIAGLAMGSTKNVDHWPEIVSLLMEQRGANIINPDYTKDKTENAINFYRNIALEQHLWDEKQEPSTTAFANGKVAMIFGVSWRAFEIQSTNSSLEFGMAPVPQLPGTRVGITNYWVEGVSNGIAKEKQDAAWKFLQYLAEKENQQHLYAVQASTRLFGEPYSRIDLAPELQNNPYLGGILDTAPSARTTYLTDKTFDGAMNEEMKALYTKYINRENEDLVVLGQKIFDLLNKNK